MSETPDPTLTEADLRPPVLDLAVFADTIGSTIRLAGELDAETGRHLRSVVERQIAHHHIDLSIDVADLDFVDLAGFDALRDAQRRLHEHGGRLRVVRYGWLFGEVAKICGMEDVLDGS